MLLNLQIHTNSKKVSRKVRIPRGMSLALHLALRCGFYWLTGEFLTFELWWLNTPDLQRKWFCLHGNVDTAPGSSCKVKLSQWNSVMLLVLLKTIKRISFYYFLVSFLSLDSDCITECTHRNVGWNHTAGRIKDPLSGGCIMNCKMYI